MKTNTESSDFTGSVAHFTREAQAIFPKLSMLDTALTYKTIKQAIDDKYYVGDSACELKRSHHFMCNAITAMHDAGIVDSDSGRIALHSIDLMMELIYCESRKNYDILDIKYDSPDTKYHTLTTTIKVYLGLPYHASLPEDTCLNFYKAWLNHMKTVIEGV